MVVLGRVVLVAVISGAAACDFDNEIDPYTEYYNLNGDWNAFTADDCKASCCNEPTCTVWQFAQYPMGHQAQCMWGDSSDYGDSGGIQFQGEQGRGAPDDPSNPSSGSHHKHHKCVGVHCDDLDLTVWLILFGVAAGLYTTGGLYYGMAVQGKRGFAAMPNANFWQDIGGLVKDGAVFALSGGTTKAQPRASYAPVPQVGQVGQFEQVGQQVVPTAVVVQPQEVQPAVVVAASVSDLLRALLKSLVLWLNLVCVRARVCVCARVRVCCVRLAVSWKKETREEGQVSDQESSREEDQVKFSRNPEWEQLRVRNTQCHLLWTVNVVFMTRAKCYIHEQSSVNAHHVSSSLPDATHSCSSNSIQVLREVSPQLFAC